MKISFDKYSELDIKVRSIYPSSVGRKLKNEIIWTEHGVRVASYKDNELKISGVKNSQFIRK